MWTLHGEASSSFVNHGNSDDEFSEQPSKEYDISELLRDLICGLDDEGIWRMTGLLSHLMKI
jgi:hypothetical protein